MASVLPVHQEPIALGELAELYRATADKQLDPARRTALGQFLTPAPIARFMASMFTDTSTEEIKLLDPGAGIGNLTAAYVAELLKGNWLPKTLKVTCYEIEPILVEYLNTTLAHCKEYCDQKQVRFDGSILQKDFIRHGVKTLVERHDLFGNNGTAYSHCIMNPPYKKIQNNSEYRLWLRNIDVETSNLYAGFLSVAIKLLIPGGQLVAIVPRSFCNGPYFNPFRNLLLDSMALTRLHVFESRDQAFKDNEVLQENVIFHAVKGELQKSVRITTSHTTDFEDMTERDAPFEQVVRTDDPQRFIHIAAHDFDQSIADHMRVFTHSLSELGLSVSTGPVVDFRLQKDILLQPETGTVPLIYSAHFTGSTITWPNHQTKKPNAIRESEESRKWLMSNGWYTLTKRFSAKEEKRRVVATVYDPSVTESGKIGIENHLNVFHENGRGLDPLTSKGLAIYLNSTLVDLYFRQFNGHTQVNAADLRTLPYPDVESLKLLGKQAEGSSPTQAQIDDWLNGVIQKMSKKPTMDPTRTTRKLAEALAVLKQLGFPRAQQNDRSALTLLALIGLKPSNRWTAASGPLIGITPIMDFCRQHYGRNYAPNTRETFRRQTMHQFVQAGLAVANPDNRDRPINSPNWVYQIEMSTLSLLKTWGTKAWDKKLAAHLAAKDTLTSLYAKERKLRGVPVSFKGKKLMLTTGKHNELIKQTVEIFVPQFASGSHVLYIGDTGSKLAHFDEMGFHKLGLRFDSHGKFPDAIFHYPKKNWLLLIEAVTSHGPVNPKRHIELKRLFARSKAGLIYVTAFPDRRTAAHYLSEISWETEVWVAENPTHLIHFDGKRFLGPY